MTAVVKYFQLQSTHDITHHSATACIMQSNKSSDNIALYLLDFGSVYMDTDARTY